MKEFFLVAFTSTLLILLNLTTGFTQQPTGPRIFFEKRFFDAKEVKEGDLIEHTFKVQNLGDSPLEIKRVKPG